MYISITFLLLLYSCLYSQPQITFQAQPESVEMGDSIVVSWKVSRAYMVYLTNYGRVEQRGHLTIFPEKARMTLTLLAQGVDGIATSSVRITVQGGRGDVFPNEDQFHNEYQYEISSPSLIELLNGIHVALQMKMGFVVDERYDRRSGITVFVTTLSERSDWMKSQVFAPACWLTGWKWKKTMGKLGAIGTMSNRSFNTSAAKKTSGM
ncbi:MAG: hypothetical protein L0287_08290 [Anaerolineae bacterium]|nr:hypothetical protein [Anaerolineae bacterium]